MSPESVMITVSKDKDESSCSPLLAGDGEGGRGRVGREGRRRGAGATCFGPRLVLLLVVGHVLEQVDLEHGSAASNTSRTFNPMHKNLGFCVR